MVREGFLPDFKSQNEILFVKIEHCTIYKSTSTVLRVRIYGRISSSEPRVQLAIKISGNKRTMQSKPNQIIRNEVLFYRIFTKFCKKKIFVKYYFLNFAWNDLQKPVLVFEDLIAQNYKQFKSKLDEEGLKVCLKGLAWFHADGMKLINYNLNSLKAFLQNLTFNDIDKEWNTHENAAR